MEFPIATSDENMLKVAKQASLITFEDLSVNANSWKTYASVFFKGYDWHPKPNIAAFDMDDTLLSVRKGGKYPKDRSDWKFAFPTVTNTLRKLNKTHSLVIISNQNGVEKNLCNVDDLTGKVDDFQKAVGVPLLVFLATGDDVFRKPKTGCWKLLQVLQGDTPIEKAFYCGDAAGRMASKPIKVKADHSDSDLKLALNLGIEFISCDRFFRGIEVSPIPKSFDFDPRRLKKPNLETSSFLLKELGFSKVSEQPEIVLLIGSPASGKSFLCSKFLPNHRHINQDTLRTAARCIAECEKAIQNGESVVIDNQNYTKAGRMAYVNIGAAKGIPVKAIFLDFPKEFCFHLNAFRKLKANTPDFFGNFSTWVSPAVIFTFFSHLEIPRESEGFSVHTITLEDFEPGPFSNQDEAELFYQFIA